MNLGSTSWTINPTSCPAITYSIIDTATGLTADSIFSISAGSLFVNTNSILKVATYNLQVRGTITGTYKTYLVDNQAITVNVGDKCSSATITTTPITNFNYDI
jgi:hypothetical protein